MEEQRALDIIMQLADGVDPATGASFPPESPYHSPDVIRALFMATLGLKFQLKYKGRKLPGGKPPGRAGAGEG